MSTTTERKISVASGLGNADASQVMAGSTFSSESGFNQEGKFIPSADNITYDNATSKLGSTNTQGAIDEIVTLTNESGHSIDVTLNKSTYVMAISLKDKNGEVLNEKTVDFPMETAFVNASYDKASKTMKFTLESGSTVDVPLGDLVEGLVSQTDFDVLRGEVENNTNAISEIKANITTNIYNLNDVVKGKWITGKNGSTGDSTSWAYLPLKVKGLKTVTISALGGVASWNKHYFNDSNGTTIDYNNSQVTASVPSDATILYVNIYEEFTDINDIKITTESVGEVVTDINASLSVLGKCKNLLKPTLGSGTGNGITYVNNGDGSFTLSGTCTNTFELHFNSTLKLPYGKYKLLGTSAFQKDNNGAWKATLTSGDVFEVSESKPVLDVIAYITSGSVVDETFKPMVTANLNATEDDFVPYTGDGDTLTEDVAEMKNDVDNKYIDTFYLGSNSSTTFDISDRVKSRYPIMIMLYPVDDQPGIWNYVGVIMPSSLDIHIVTLNSSNIEVTMDSNYIITVKNTNGDWGTHFKMRLI